MKKNIVITILVLLVVGLSCFIVYDKVINKDGKKETSVEEQTKNIDLVTTNVEKVFNDFAKKQNLKVTTEGYDYDSLKQNNCENAVNATGSGYLLEMYTFKDVESAKEEYQKQKNYEISTNNEKQLLNSSSNDRYDIYEAIMVPDLSQAPAASGDEIIYTLHLRVQNYLISFFQSSSDENKTTYINLVKELKAMVNVE